MFHFAPLRFCFVAGVAILALARAGAAEPEPLFDWSDWEKFRGGVEHPSGAFKPADISRARENLRRYAWAKAYLAGLERGARGQTGKLTREMFVEIFKQAAILADT